MSDSRTSTVSTGDTLPSSSLQGIDELRRRLTEIAGDVRHWSTEVQLLREATRRAGAATDDSLLLSVEETSGSIYRAIDVFDQILVDVDRKSHVAAGQIAEVGDALRLVLLEITELGTSLYSLRSRNPSLEIAEVPQPVEFALSSNGDSWVLYPAEGDGLAFVEHRANKPSGGAITRMSVGSFLAETPTGPQHEALRLIL